SDAPIPDPRALGGGQVRDRPILEQVGAFGGRVEQPQQRQQCRLAAPRRPGDRDVLALLDLEMDIRERVGLHLVGVEDLLDALKLNQRRTVAGHRLSLRGQGSGSAQPLTPSPYFILTRSTLSQRDMSDRITSSPALSPCTTSIELTELRPTCTGTRTA